MSLCCVSGAVLPMSTSRRTRELEGVWGPTWRRASSLAILLTTRVGSSTILSPRSPSSQSVPSLMSATSSASRSLSLPSSLPHSLRTHPSQQPSSTHLVIPPPEGSDDESDYEDMYDHGGVGNGSNPPHPHVHPPHHPTPPPAARLCYSPQTLQGLRGSVGNHGTMMQPQITRKDGRGTATQSLS